MTEDDMIKQNFTQSLAFPFWEYIARPYLKAKSICWCITEACPWSQNGPGSKGENRRHQSILPRWSYFAEACVTQCVEQEHGARNRHTQISFFLNKADSEHFRFARIYIYIYTYIYMYIYIYICIYLKITTCLYRGKYTYTFMYWAWRALGVHVSPSSHAMNAHFVAQVLLNQKWPSLSRLSPPTRSWELASCGVARQG